MGKFSLRVSGKPIFLGLLLFSLVPISAWGQACTIDGQNVSGDKVINTSVVLNSKAKQIVTGSFTVRCARDTVITFARDNDVSGVQNTLGRVQTNLGMTAPNVNDKKAGYIESLINYRFSSVNETVNLRAGTINGGRPSNTTINVRAGQSFRYDYTITVDAQKQNYNKGAQATSWMLTILRMDSRGLQTNSVTVVHNLNTTNAALCNANSYEITLPNNTVSFGEMRESAFDGGRSHWRKSGIEARMKPESGCTILLEPKITLYANGTPNAQNEVAIGDSGLLLSIKAHFGVNPYRDIVFGREYSAGNTVYPNGDPHIEDIYFFIRKDPSKPLKPGGFSTTVKYIYTYP